MDGTVREPRYRAVLIMASLAAVGGYLAHAGINAHVQSDAAESDAVALEDDALSRSGAEFLDRMRHDLRTPLNAILGFGQLLEMDELTADQSESVAEIIKGGRQLLELINRDITSPALRSNPAGQAIVNQGP
jgi:signal transduction histidine kinase